MLRIDSVNTQNWRRSLQNRHRVITSFDRSAGTAMILCLSTSVPDNKWKPVGLSWSVLGIITSSWSCLGVSCLKTNYLIVICLLLCVRSMRHLNVEEDVLLSSMWNGSMAKTDWICNGKDLLWMLRTWYSCWSNSSLRYHRWRKTLILRWLELKRYNFCEAVYVFEINTSVSSVECSDIQLLVKATLPITIN